MGVFDFLRKKSDVRTAKQAELHGDLARAVELYGLAGADGEAARVMILRGDAETDGRVRLQYYVQAASMAPEGALRDAARKKRASLLVSQLGQGRAVSSAARRELSLAAAELLAVGDAVGAADAYRLAGDKEGEARALAQSGDVERLESLLHEEQLSDRQDHLRTQLHADVELMIASGRRREALAAAETWLAGHGDDAPMRERASVLKSRRALGPLAQLRLRGERMPLVLGHDVVIGRTEGTLLVPSQAVSRQHVRIAREDGVVVVRDLGSRNGTQLRGMNLVGALPVGDGLELTLGKEVRLRLSPSSSFDGAVAIELGGERYVAPIGPARISGLPWELREGSDPWIELVTGGRDAYIGEMSLVSTVTLLVGDVLACERGGAEVLRVVGE